MANANDFVRALQAKGHGGVETVNDYWRRQKREWLEDLLALRSAIRQWLGPVSAAGLATVVDRDDVSLTEPDLGHYLAPELAITLLVPDEPRTVLLRPRGMAIVGLVGARGIGARGRVDLECGVVREILLRSKDKAPTRWLSFSGGEQKTLDEELFFELLARITEIKVR